MVTIFYNLKVYRNPTLKVSQQDEELQAYLIRGKLLGFDIELR